MDCDCDICENHEYDTQNRMNFSETKSFIDGDFSFLDERKSLLTFYQFCPWCGKKINWKEIKLKLKENNKLGFK